MLQELRERFEETNLDLITIKSDNKEIQNEINFVKEELESKIREKDALFEKCEKIVE